jgi:hypothetical protein
MKHLLKITSTMQGIQIDRKMTQAEKAYWPILLNLEFASKTTAMMLSILTQWSGNSSTV